MGFHFQGSKPNVAMAVSIGTGIYPPEKLGEVDFFSKGFLDLRGTLNRAKKLIKMLSTAVSVSLIETSNSYTRIKIVCIESYCIVHYTDYSHCELCVYCPFVVFNSWLNPKELPKYSLTPVKLSTLISSVSAPLSHTLLDLTRLI